MHRSRKPVRKCRGCELNFHDHCGVYANPHDQWHNRKRCPGFMNEALLEEYRRKQALISDKKGRERRKKELTAADVERQNGDRHVVRMQQ